MRPIPIPVGYAQAIHPRAYTRVLGAPGDGSLIDDEISALEVVWHPFEVRGTAVAAARSLWLPSDDELAAITTGAYITVTVVSAAHPPLALGTEPAVNADY